MRRFPSAPPGELAISAPKPSFFPGQAITDPATAPLDRRSFLAASAKTAAAAAALHAAPGSLLALPPASQFPANFVWGASTSAMQVEGYPYADGGGRSVWSVFDTDTSKVKDGTNILLTDDTYHRWAGDLPLMRQIGLNSYRLSISWPRVLPQGRGTPNPGGLDYYDRLLDGLLHAGITPWVTAFHFDYPEALQKEGGWLNPDSPQWLADYAHLLSARYSDRVSHWFTINEPNIAWTFSSEAGIMPPFNKFSREQLALGAHHILLGHGQSVQAMRAAAKRPVEIGLPFAGMMSLPATESPADVAAARARSFAVQEQKLGPEYPPLAMINNSWWLDPIYLGRYPQEGFALFPTAEKLATPDAMATIRQPLDFCAITYTSRRMCGQAPMARPKWCRSRKPCRAAIPDGPSSRSCCTGGRAFCTNATASRLWSARMASRSMTP